MPKYTKSAFRPFKASDFTLGSYINTGDTLDTLGVSDMLMNSNWLIGSKPYNLFKQFTKGIKQSHISTNYTLMWFGDYRLPLLPGRGFNGSTIRITLNLKATGDFTLRGTVNDMSVVTSAYTATAAKQEVTLDISTNITSVDNYLTIDVKGTLVGIDVTFYDINVELVTLDYSDQLLNSAFGSTAASYASGMVDITNLTTYDLAITSYTFEAGASGNPNAELYTYDGTSVGHSTSTGWTLRDSQKVSTVAGVNETVILATPFVIPAGSTMGVYVTPDATFNLVKYKVAASVSDSDAYLKLVSNSINDYNFGTIHTGNQIAIGFNYERVLASDNYSEDLFIPQDTEAAVDGKPLNVAMLRGLMINNHSGYNEYPRVLSTYYNPWSDIDTSATDQLEFTSTTNYDEAIKIVYFKRSPDVKSVLVRLYGFTDGFVAGDTGALCRVGFEGGSVAVDRLDSAAADHAVPILNWHLFVPPGIGPHYLTIYGQACPDTGNHGVIYAYTIREEVSYS